MKVENKQAEREVQNGLWYWLNNKQLATIALLFHQYKQYRVPLNSAIPNMTNQNSCYTEKVTDSGELIRGSS